MRIIISPAKKMVADRDGFAPESLPLFLEQAELLAARLRAMSPGELQALWRCSGAIAALNTHRLAHMDLRRGLTPAVMAYEGIQYRYMAPRVMEREHLNYLREHLRILSGFYGLLRPFDGVTPYRLEMQSPLAVEGCRDLYQFWGGRLANALAAETGLVVNLASREYSRAVKDHLPPSLRFVTCTFGEREGDRVVEKGTRCKMARGQMVRWLAENRVTDPAALSSFDQLGYRFHPTLSSPDHLVFLLRETGPAPSEGGL